MSFLEERVDETEEKEGWPERVDERKVDGGGVIGGGEAGGEAELSDGMAGGTVMESGGGMRTGNSTRIAGRVDGREPSGG